MELGFVVGRAAVAEAKFLSLPRRDFASSGEVDALLGER
jgi:hypothetical protein